MARSGRLAGKVAVVTGATSGMGAAVARTFAAEGASVVVAGRDRQRGEAVVEEIREAGGQAVLRLGDVADPDHNRELAEEAVRSFGALHLLVPCAGILGLGSATGTAPEDWDRTIAVNLSSVFYLSHYGIPKLLESGGGAMVVVGSIAAYKGFPNHAAYCASKGALVPFVKQISVDYAPKVRANLLCPGPVDTPLIWESAAAFPNPAEAVAEAGRKTLIGRLGLPQDIADAALFLACDDSRWISGAALTIDGGILCR